MILIRPRKTSARVNRWHHFDGEDHMERWRTLCGQRLYVADFQSGPFEYLECMNCRRIWIERMKEAA